MSDDPVLRSQPKGGGGIVHTTTGYKETLSTECKLSRTCTFRGTMLAHMPTTFMSLVYSFLLVLTMNNDCGFRVGVLGRPLCAWIRVSGWTKESRPRFQTVTPRARRRARSEQVTLVGLSS